MMTPLPKQMEDLTLKISMDSYWLMGIACIRVLIPQGNACASSAMRCRSLALLPTAPLPGAKLYASHSTSCRRVRVPHSLGACTGCLVSLALPSPPVLSNKKTPAANRCSSLFVVLL